MLVACIALRLAVRAGSGTSSSERDRGAGMAESSRRIRWAGSRSEAVETRPEAALRRSTHQADRGITAEAVDGSSMLADAIVATTSRAPT